MALNVISVQSYFWILIWSLLVRGQPTIPFGTNHSSHTTIYWEKYWCRFNPIALTFELAGSASTRRPSRHSAINSRGPHHSAKLCISVFSPQWKDLGIFQGVPKSRNLSSAAPLERMFICYWFQTAQNRWVVTGMTRHKKARSMKFRASITKPIWTSRSTPDRKFRWTSRNFHFHSEFASPVNKWEGIRKVMLGANVMKGVAAGHPSLESSAFEPAIKPTAWNAIFFIRGTLGTHFYSWVDCDAPSGRDWGHHICFPVLKCIIHKNILAGEKIWFFSEFRSLNKWNIRTKKYWSFFNFNLTGSASVAVEEYRRSHERTSNQVCGFDNHLFRSQVSFTQHQTL